MASVDRAGREATQVNIFTGARVPPGFINIFSHYAFHLGNRSYKAPSELLVVVAEHGQKWSALAEVTAFERVIKYVNNGFTNLAHFITRPTRPRFRPEGSISLLCEYRAK
jgi:hypothetical protein